MNMPMRKKLSYIIEEVETEIEDYYKNNFPNDISDFNKLTSEQEIDILTKCIELIPRCKSKRKERISYLAVVSFYYLVVASEYYVYINPSNILGETDIDDYVKIFFRVSSSNEEWASKIRRLVYKFD